MKRTAAIAAFAVSLALLPSCSPEPDNTRTPTPVVTTTAADTPTPTESPTTEPPEPSPSPTDSLTADQLAARSVVNEFFRLSDELSQHPELSLQPLADITTGQTQAVYLQEIIDFREMNAVQIGDLKWRFVTVGSPAQQNGEISVPVEVCTDSSEIDIIDQESEVSILPADRPTSITWNFRAASPTGTKWLVEVSSSTIDSGCQV